MSVSEATVELAVSAIPKGKKLLVALSGGVDSVVLTHALVKMYKGTIAAAHLDHGLRLESNKDREWVKRFCSELAIKLHSKKIRPTKTKNIGAWGRSERYTYFKQILKSYNYDILITAHHADDLAETYLMQILSNRDGEGVVFEDQSRSLIRPLIFVTRKTIEQYAKSNRLKWREDNTNKDTSFLRNRVRIELIPFLKRKFDKSISRILSERAFSQQLDQQALSFYSHNLFQRYLNLYSSTRTIRLYLREQASIPKAVLWRLHRDLLESQFGIRLGRRACQKAVDFINSEHKEQHIGGGIAILRQKEGKITIKKINN